MTADRRKRHLRILEVISTRAIRTQEDLAEALRAEGWGVTQSSVSRDITALGLVKAEGAYRRPAPGSRVVDPDERRIADGLLSCDSSCFTPLRERQTAWRWRWTDWHGPM
jgi:arginine repressor